MNIVQVPCPGCKKLFSPRGLSQHLSRTQCAHCRVVHAALQTPTVLQTMRQVDAGDDNMDIDVVDSDTWGANTADAWNANAADTTNAADTLDADTWEALQ